MVCSSTRRGNFSFRRYDRIEGKVYFSFVVTEKYINRCLTFGIDGCAVGSMAPARSLHIPLLVGRVTYQRTQQQIAWSVAHTFGHKDEPKPDQREIFREGKDPEAIAVPHKHNRTYQDKLSCVFRRESCKEAPKCSTDD